MTADRVETIRSVISHLYAMPGQELSEWFNAHRLPGGWVFDGPDVLHFRKDENGRAVLIDDVVQSHEKGE